MKYDWILFDADGTIFDYDRAEADALQCTFAQHGCPFELKYIEIYRTINAKLWRGLELAQITPGEIKVQRFRLLFQELGLDADSALFGAHYLHHLGEQGHLISGAGAVIRHLHGKVGLALITNGLHDVQRRRLARSSLEPYFAPVIISEEVGAAKPDGRIFDVAFQQMGQPAKQAVLMVGDSLTSDMLGGVRYGLDTCWFNPARRAGDPAIPVTYEIADLGDLLKMVA